MKHEPASLLERAAELYDFGAALRPSPDEAPAEAVEPSRGPAPDRAVSASARAVVVDRLKLAGRGCILPNEPVTGLAEEVRLVKRQLLAGIERRSGQPEAKRRTILIASPESGDGKTFCALNLAISIASERDFEALLIDGDFSRPELLPALGIEPGRGFVDALADASLDPERLVLRTDIPGLSVLPAGGKVNDVPELLASARTGVVLARLVERNKRRVILIDSPPVLAASAASILAAQVGEVLLVVRADRTTEAALRETAGLLSGCPEVSLLLNGAGFAAGGRRYGRYEAYGDAD